jgi:hypothetical protein
MLAGRRPTRRLAPFRVAEDRSPLKTAGASPKARPCQARPVTCLAPSERPGSFPLPVRLDADRALFAPLDAPPPWTGEKGQTRRGGLCPRAERPGARLAARTGPTRLGPGAGCREPGPARGGGPPGVGPASPTPPGPVSALENPAPLAAPQVTMPDAGCEAACASLSCWGAWTWKGPTSRQAGPSSP